MIETSKGKTPNGGVTARISYLDEAMKPCDKKNAVNMIIQEYDDQGKMIMETWGTVKQGELKKNFGTSEGAEKGWLKRPRAKQEITESDFNEILDKSISTRSSYRSDEDITLEP